jgi:CheY-like chemotaxis protein
MPPDVCAQKRLVLVADDDPDSREAIAEILHIEGFAVVMAGNGKQALELARAANPSVVLLDLMMPIVSGLDFLRYRKARPELAKIPVIVVSAVIDLKLGAEAHGADAILQKPVDIVRLVNLIKQFSAGG